MNQQSDSADLLGGFKPVDLKFVVGPVRREFEQNLTKKYLANIALCFNTQRWNDLVKLMNRSYQAAVTRLNKALSEFNLESSEKITFEDEQKFNKKRRDEEFLARWQAVGDKLEKLDLQLRQKTTLAFAYTKEA
ncbi:hypothetical protein NQ318_016494 [Aromia moschata]|uniref:Uncharacterized protein n=1 Tax=Aromia moschata TaxID=1265417 RepID=A0AAV8X5T8_9CUCU|nr:hypothetical protein NQ318_016494 [Aromia moschata]